jgi:hypothetical protein
MGIRLDREQIDSFVLLWRYAGHVLGIDAALLPTTIEEQQAFYLSSCKHQVRPEKVMPQTKTLLDAVAKQAKLVPYPIAQTFLHQVTCYLSGNDYIAGMQLEDRGDRYFGVRGLRYLGQAASFVHRHMPFGERMFYRAGLQMYRRELAKNERKKKYRYRVQVRETAAHRAQETRA